MAASRRDEVRELRPPAQLERRSRASLRVIRKSLVCFPCRGRRRVGRLD
jgi:hypothetical protein